MDKKMPGCTTGRHWGRDDPRGPHAWTDEEEDWVDGENDSGPEAGEAEVADRK